MKNNSALERLYNGIIKENPTLVLILGMCPTCGNNIGNQWCRYGTFYNRSINVLQYDYFYSA